MIEHGLVLVDTQEVDKAKIESSDPHIEAEFDEQLEEIIEEL